jgi:hypothetical protein
VRHLPYHRSLRVTERSAVWADSHEEGRSHVRNFMGPGEPMSQAACSLCRAFASLSIVAYERWIVDRSIAISLKILPAFYLCRMTLDRWPSNRPSNMLGIWFATKISQWDAGPRCSTKIQGLILPLPRPGEEELEDCHGVALCIQIGNANRIVPEFASTLVITTVWAHLSWNFLHVQGTSLIPNYRLQCTLIPQRGTHYEFAIGI